MIYKNFLTNTGVYYGSMRDGAAFGLLTEINEAAARGARAGAVEVQIRIPAEMDKSRIHSIRNHIKKAEERLEAEGFLLEQLSVTGEKCAAIRVPETVITVAAEDVRKKQLTEELLTARAGWDIVYAGWAGLEGMLRIIGEKEAELRTRFTPAFISQMKAYDHEVCGLPKIAAADAMGVSVIRQVSRGGILASLWDLAKETEMGLWVDLKKIAVRQETIEVCEHFRLNPYQLASGGSFLMLTENGEAVADALKHRQIEAAVIGQLTDSNDKVIRNGEDVRYIDRPAPDELMKIF